MSTTRRCLQNVFPSTAARRLVQRKLPVTRWLPKYSWVCLQGDLIAGLTVGLTVIPQGLAYAQIAQLPPQYGLYSSFIGCFVYTLFGTSKDITLGPTAIMSLMTATFAVSPVPGDATVAILLSLITGVVQILMSVLNVGFIVNFISTPVMSSFVTSAAITIALGQFPKLLGIEGIPKNFFKKIYWLCSRITETNVYDLLLGSVVFCILVTLKYLKNRYATSSNNGDLSLCRRCLVKYVWIIGTARNAILVVLSSVFVACLLHNGLDPFTRTAAIQPGVPPFSVPRFSLHTANVTMDTRQIFTHIGSGILIVPLIGFIETIAIGKAFARQNNYIINANQELLASGVANVAGTFFSAYPVTGSFSRTAINSQSGVQTPAGGIFTGCLIIVALLAFTPFLPYIPSSCLSVVIIAAVMDMTNFSLVKKLWTVNKIDLIPWTVTFVFSFVMGIEYGIIFGVFVSLLLLLYPASRPNIKVIQNRVVIMELNNGLLFPAIDHVSDKINKEALNDNQAKSAILDMKHVSHVDISSLQGLKCLSEDFNARDTLFVITNVQAHILSSIMKCEMNHIRICNNNEDAIRLIYEEREPKDDNPRESLIAATGAALGGNREEGGGVGDTLITSRNIQGDFV